MPNIKQSLPILPQFTCFTADSFFNDQDKNIRPDDRTNLIGAKNTPFTFLQENKLAEIGYYKGANYILCFNGKKVEVIAVARISH